jgi:hypothetical protein
VINSTARNEKEYFRTRAMQELERAQASSHPAAMRSHSDLAGYYLTRASADGSILR